MKTTLRVLLVEDSEIDAQLVLRQFASAGYPIESRRVDNEAEYLEALKSKDLELVICDYTMPTFSAKNALSLLKERELDLPFIVVSGSISTDVAIEMMRLGAHDYILKNDMARLVPAVERELREAARRKQHRASDEAREEAELRYRELYQITSDVIKSITIDDQGEFRLTHWNATCEQVFGIHLPQDAGKPLRELMPCDFANQCIVGLTQCLYSGKTEHIEQTFHHGIYTLHFHTKIHPVKDENGKIKRMVVVSRDITDRKRSEETLRKTHSELERRVKERTAELTSANARLRELDRLKSEFLATMSHELRTPLNSIIGFTSVVKEEIAGPLNDEQKKQLSMVYSASKHLLGLINDLLDVSRIEAGRLKLANEPFDFARVVAETIAQIKPLAQAKRLVLRPQLPSGALPVIGDHRRCLQVLLNLVHNAVKFTEKGTIDIVVRSEPDLMRVDVIDTGIGIREEQLGQLFEAFRQLDGSARRCYEGTGLGLYLCRKLLNLIGGEISAHSVHGQGTRVSFTVPRQLKQDTHTHLAEPHSSRAS